MRRDAVGRPAGVDVGITPRHVTYTYIHTCKIEEEEKKRGGRPCLALPRLVSPTREYVLLQERNGGGSAGTAVGWRPTKTDARCETHRTKGGVLVANWPWLRHSEMAPRHAHDMTVG